MIATEHLLFLLAYVMQQYAPKPQHPAISDEQLTTQKHKIQDKELIANLDEDAKSVFTHAIQTHSS